MAERYSDSHEGWGILFTHRPGAMDFLGPGFNRPFINNISGGWCAVFETREEAEREAEARLRRHEHLYESAVPVWVEKGQRQLSIAEQEEAERAAAHAAELATLHTRIAELEAVIRPRLREHSQIAAELWREDQTEAMDAIAIELTRELHRLFPEEP